MIHSNDVSLSYYLVAYIFICVGRLAAGVFFVLKRVMQRMIIVFTVSAAVIVTDVR